MTVQEEDRESFSVYLSTSHRISSELVLSRA